MNRTWWLTLLSWGLYILLFSCCLNIVHTQHAHTHTTRTHTTRNTHIHTQHAHTHTTRTHTQHATRTYTHNTHIHTQHTHTHTTRTYTHNILLICLFTTLSCSWRFLKPSDADLTQNTRMLWVRNNALHCSSYPTDLVGYCLLKICQPNFVVLFADDLDELEVYGKQEQFGTQLTSYTFEVRVNNACCSWRDPPCHVICTYSTWSAPYSTWSAPCHVICTIYYSTWFAPYSTWSVPYSTWSVPYITWSAPCITSYSSLCCWQLKENWMIFFMTCYMLNKCVLLKPCICTL